ncbi:hypothetical protein U1Q18_034699 [Sarracenia purpurea var. burkii]
MRGIIGFEREEEEDGEGEDREGLLCRLSGSGPKLQFDDPMKTKRAFFERGFVDVVALTESRLERSKVVASRWGSEPSTTNSPAQLRVHRAREKLSRTIAPLDLARDDSLCDFRQCTTLRVIFRGDRGGNESSSMRRKVWRLERIKLIHVAK